MDSGSGTNLVFLNGDRSSLDEWADWLLKQEMPIFSHTAKQIYQTMESGHAGAMQLSNIILQDPNLTARLLKISNTPYYNPSKQKMSTITRAIVILGYGVVKELSLACSFIEEIITQDSKETVNRQIAKAIHAAVQAKSLAQQLNDSSPEEIFIAALLKNIGEIVFACYAPEQNEQIEILIGTQNLTRDEAEKQVLGFHIRELGGYLSSQWKLGGLIDDAIQNKETKRTEIISYAHQIADHADQGWRDSQIPALMMVLESETKMSSANLISLLEKNAETATKIARQFGAHDAAELIPTDLSLDGISALENERESGTHTDERTVLAINTKLQFQILQDITMMFSGPIDINMLMELILEGIHRAIGMDHTLFAMFTPDRKTLREKYSIGWSEHDSNSPFEFTLKNESNIFNYALKKHDVTWIHPKRDYQLAHLFTPEVEDQLGIQECFLMPVHINGRNIGVFYSDRTEHKPPLNNEACECFRHFTQQGNVGLALSRQPGNTV